MTDILAPPCKINFMTVGDSKIPSKMITLNIESDKNEKGNNGGFTMHAIRPE